MNKVKEIRVKEMKVNKVRNHLRKWNRDKETKQYIDGNKGKVGK